MLLGGRLPAAMRDAVLERAAARLLISYGATETGSIAIGEHDVDRAASRRGRLPPPGRRGRNCRPEGRHSSQPASRDWCVPRSDLMVAAYDRAPAPAAAGTSATAGSIRAMSAACMKTACWPSTGAPATRSTSAAGKSRPTTWRAKVAEIPGIKDVCAVDHAAARWRHPDLRRGLRRRLDLPALRTASTTCWPRAAASTIIRLPAIPRNAMGKIPRALIASQLAALYGATKKSPANA